MPGADEEELSNADKSGLIKIAKKYFKDRKHLTNPNYAAGINLDWIKSALETGEYEFEHKDPLRLVEMYLKRVQYDVLSHSGFHSRTANMIITGTDSV